MYRQLATQAPTVLKKGGRLLVEMGYDQRAAVLEIFKPAGNWTYIGAHRNATDTYDRVAELEYN